MPKVVLIDININSVPGGRDPSPLAKVCEREGYNLEIWDLREPDEIIEKVKDADAIVTIYTKIDRQILEHCKNLKVAIRAAVGPDVFNLDDCTEFNVPACNVPNYSTQEVAAHTVTLALALARRIAVSNHLVHSGQWNISCARNVHRLSTMTMGFVGFGRIARQAAEYAGGFGFTICAYDPYLPAQVFEQAGVKQVSTDELFQTCDIICVNTPLTESTRHIIDHDAVSKMKDGVCIVNTGRGACIETAALVDGLRSGKICGVGLDVIEEEPLRDKDAEILQFENVIITSHTGYASEEAKVDQYRLCGETIVQVLNGELPDNVLNRDALLKRRRT